MLLGVVLLLMAIAAILVIARFEVFCIRDLLSADESELQLLPRSGWLVVIVLAIPLGGLAYLFYGRTR